MSYYRKTIIQEIAAANPERVRTRYCVACCMDGPHLFPLWRMSVGDQGYRFDKTSQRICVECGYAYENKPVTNKKLRREVLDADSHECVYCGGTDDLCLDHVIPQSLGGVTDFDNLVTSCRSCNSKKKDSANVPTMAYGRYRMEGAS